MKLAHTILVTALLALGATIAEAAPIYWDNTASTGFWTDSKWSTSSGGGSNTSFVDGDAAFFSSTPTGTGSQTTDLAGSFSLVDALNFQSGTVTLKTTVTNTLNLFSGGITVANTVAGTSTIDSSLRLALFLGSQSWTNNSSQLLSIGSTVFGTGGSKVLTLSNTSSGGTTISGQIQNAWPISITVSNSGTGVTTFSNSTNNYDGTTSVDVGTLVVTANNALGATTAGTTVASGGALKLSGVNYSTAEALTINGSGVSGSGALYVSAGSSTYAGNVTAATNADIRAAPSSTLTLTGTLNKSGTVCTLGGGGTIVTGVITGNNNSSDLVIDGATVVMKGASTYNGPTIVKNGGVLVANNTTGSAVGTGNVSVDSTSSLSGTGRVDVGTNRFITLASALKVGDSTLGSPVASKLTLASGGTGSTTLGATSTLSMDLITGAGLGDNSATTTAADILGVVGNFNITAGAVLKVDSALSGWAAGDRWRIFDWTNVGTISGAFSNILPTLGAGLAWDTSNLFTTTGALRGTLAVQNVPEPGSTLLLGLAGIALAVGRRRRQIPLSL